MQPATRQAARSPACLQAQRPQREQGGVGVVQHIVLGVLPIAQGPENSRRHTHHQRLLPEPGGIKLGLLAPWWQRWRRRR